MKLLVVTYKRCFRVGNRLFTDGGSPKEFNTLSSKIDVHLLTSIVDVPQVKPEWGELNRDIKCYSLGRIIEFSSLPTPIWSMCRAAHLARQIVRQEGIDIVLLRGPSEISMAPLFALNELAVPTVYQYSLDWIHDVEVSSRKTFLRRLLRPYFTAIVSYRKFVLRTMLPKAFALATVSTAYVEKLASYSPREVYLLRNTFTTSEAEIPSTVIPPQAGQDRFLFVGRIDRNKNLQLVIRALALLKEKLPESKPVFDIVGAGSEIKSVLNMADQLGVKDRVNYIGPVHHDDLPQYLSGALALILPSISETLGKVIVESLTFGTPVIGSNVGGIPDLITDSFNGFLIDPASPESLSDKMICILTNRELAISMRRNAAQSARKFTREATLIDWITAFEKIVVDYQKVATD